MYLYGWSIKAVFRLLNRLDNPLAWLLWQGRTILVALLFNYVAGCWGIGKPATTSTDRSLQLMLSRPYQLSLSVTGHRPQNLHAAIFRDSVKCIHDGIIFRDLTKKSLQILSLESYKNVQHTRYLFPSSLVPLNDGDLGPASVLQVQAVSSSLASSSSGKLRNSIWGSRSFWFLMLGSFSPDIYIVYLTHKSKMPSLVFF